MQLQDLKEQHNILLLGTTLIGDSAVVLEKILPDDIGTSYLSDAGVYKDLILKMRRSNIDAVSERELEDEDGDNKDIKRNLHRSRSGSRSSNRAEFLSPKLKAINTRVHEDGSRSELLELVADGR